MEELLLSEIFRQTIEELPTVTILGGILFLTLGHLFKRLEAEQVAVESRFTRLLEEHKNAQTELLHHFSELYDKQAANQNLQSTNQTQELSAKLELINKNLDRALNALLFLIPEARRSSKPKQKSKNKPVAQPVHVIEFTKPESTDIV
jgi:hypothetical protein